MTSLDQLANEITKAVREYTEDVAEGIEKRVDEVADLIREDAAANAPVRTGKYRQGFTKTKQDGFGNTRRIVWNKKASRRVHLLEFGHAKKGGGRVPGRPHLRPAYDKYAGTLADDIKRIIRNGGGL
ncbi:hypothetical protein D3C86_1321210 [compost metagenome]